MFKATRLKDYKFFITERSGYIFNGFAAVNEKCEFLSMDGKTPYVLDRKWVINGVIKSIETEEYPTITVKNYKEGK